jgi:hypothetical protein
VVFWKGVQIILNSLDFKIFKRIQNYRIIFWENRTFFSIFNLKRTICNKEIIFFEIYSFLISLYEWESNINLISYSNFYLKSITKQSQQEIVTFKSTKRVKSITSQTFLKKNSLLFYCVPKFEI